MSISGTENPKPDTTDQRSKKKDGEEDDDGEDNANANPSKFKSTNMRSHVFGTFMSAMILAVINPCTNGKLIANNAQQVENGIINAPPARISGYRTKDWIKISEAPSSVVNAQLGDRVELECEVLGSPTPQIQWLRGNQIVQQTERLSPSIHTSFPDAYHDRAGLAKIKSRLVIDCVTSKHEGFYTCVAKAGTTTSTSNQTLILLQGGNGENCGDLEKPHPPRIVTWNPTAMENIGVDVILPCMAEGNPPPTVYWLDQDNKLVDNFRFQTLSNGDLAIYRLSWPDMGQYTCVAENSVGTDAVTTFLYPVLNDK